MFRTIIRLFKSLSKTERYLVLGGLVIFVVAAGFYLPQLLYRYTTIAPAEGGEYTEGVVGQPITINPLIAGSNEPDRDLLELLFADLISLSETSKVSEDGTTWTLQLREDLKWSDGKPLTVNDVIFTIEMIQNPDTNSPLYATWQGVETARISDRELTLKTRLPYAFFFDNLKSLKVVPQHIFESIPAANLRLSNFNLEPVGSGPYKFLRADIEKDGFIRAYRLEANHAYALGQPFIPTLTIRFFKNFKEAIVAFNQREIDGVGGFDPISLSDFALSHKIIETNIPRYYALFLNQSSQPALKFLSVRAALDRAIDRSSLTGQMFDSHAMIVSGPLLPYLEGFDAAVYATSSFGTSTPEQILEEAGWKKNEEGVYQKTVDKKVQKLEVEITTPDIGFLTKTADIIKEAWEAIGIRVTVRVVHPQEINSTALKSRSYQILLFGNILRANADIYSFWHSSQRFAPGLNLSLYENKTVDKNLDTIRKEFDKEKRAAALAEIQQEIYEDIPALFLYSPSYLYATVRQLGGFEPSFIASPSARFENVHEWYLTTSRRLK